MTRKYIYSKILGEICSFYFLLQPTESTAVPLYSELSAFLIVLDFAVGTIAI